MDGIGGVVLATIVHAVEKKRRGGKEMIYAIRYVDDCFDFIRPLHRVSEIANDMGKEIACISEITPADAEWIKKSGISVKE